VTTERPSWAEVVERMRVAGDPTVVLSLAQVEVLANRTMPRCSTCRFLDSSGRVAVHCERLSHAGWNAGTSRPAHATALFCVPDPDEFGCTLWERSDG
jgi:hypothetical protein